MGGGDKPMKEIGDRQKHHYYSSLSEPKYSMPMKEKEKVMFISNERTKIEIIKK
jgi:hypothetical protein